MPFSLAELLAGSRAGQRRLHGGLNNPNRIQTLTMNFPRVNPYITTYMPTCSLGGWPAAGTNTKLAGGMPFLPANYMAPLMAVMDC